MSLKKQSLCLLLALALSACATTNKQLKVVCPPPTFSQAEVADWKAYYDKLEVDQASSMEKWLMEKGKPDQKLAQQFSWLNPSRLNDKDRLFLIRVSQGGKVFIPGLFSLPSGSIKRQQ